MCRGGPYWCRAGRNRTLMPRNPPGDISSVLQPWLEIHCIVLVGGGVISDWTECGAARVSGERQGNEGGDRRRSQTPAECRSGRGRHAARSDGSGREPWLR